MRPMNLDAQTRTELTAIWDQLSRHPRHWAKVLFGDPAPKGSTRVVRDLANYAMNKAVAIGLRDEGRPTQAQRYFDICERIYSRLPDYAQWRDTDGSPHVDRGG